jgi:ATP-dependent Clp protease ATP-binding subunit ClpA
MNEFLNLNENAKTAIGIAQSIAREHSNGEYTSAYLLKALLHKEIGLRSFIQSLDKDLSYLEEWAEVRIDACPKVGAVSEIVPNDRIPLVFEESDNVRFKLGLLEINPVCVLAAQAKPNVAFSPDQLKSFLLRENEIFELYASGLEIRNRTGYNPVAPEAENGQAPMLNPAQILHQQNNELTWNIN